MENLDILLKLRSEQQRWLTSILITEQEALQLLNLSQFSRTTVRLPSVEGYAKVSGLLLEVYYQDGQNQNIISTPLKEAHAVIQEAIELARDIRRSEAAHSRIWDWINERYDGTRVLTLSKGERISALLLGNDDEYLAIQLGDGATAIAEVTNEDAIPAPNSHITITAGDNGELFVKKDLRS